MNSFKKIVTLVCATAILMAEVAMAAKRGVAYSEDINITGFNGAGTEVNWQYNWDSVTAKRVPAFEYVPMLWSTSTDHTTNWHVNALSWIAQGTTHLLAFNEPDNPQQADLSPADAATAYRQYMSPLGGQAKLGSPAVTNAATGAPWLTDFLAVNCADCQVDFVAVHWYDTATNFAYFKSFMDNICAIADGRPVWVTEFQGSGSSADELTFMQQAIDYLDSSSCVERYAYFGAADNDKRLLVGSGPGLSALGQEFAFLPFDG